jgi:UDP-3-O-[3-hydroxymyristoyl] glucosamine N-acyltransferase
MTARLAELFAGIAAEGTELVGDGEILISGISTLEGADESQLTFLSRPKFVSQLAASRAACVIVAPAMREAAQQRGACIVAPDPYLYFALATQWWRRNSRPAAKPSTHSSAVIDSGANVSPDATVGAFVCIEAGATIGADAVIGAHCVIGQNAVIGAGSRLAPRVTIGDDCRVGERCIIHSGAVIGADGFGFAPHAGEWVKIEQLGAVQIGNDVEIGANTCIDRGALLDTVIEDGVKLDNLIQIGHNVRIGRHSAIAGCTGLAGSATVGAHCTIGGAAIILGHLTLGDHVNVSAASVVTRSISKPGLYTGFFPIDDNASWEKNAVSLKQLNSLRKRLKQIEIKLASRAEKP